MIPIQTCNLLQKSKKNNSFQDSNDSILGRVTIGRDSVIGGNVWLTRSVPEKSRILQGKTQDFTFTDGAGI